MIPGKTPITPASEQVGMSSFGGGIGINIAKGFEEYINDSPSDIDEKLDILTFSINYRTILNQRLDWFW